MAFIKGQPFKPQFDDGSGNLLNAGTIEFQNWDTSAAVNYYTDSGGTSGGTSLTLNSRGEPPNDIFLDSNIKYKFILKDSAGSTISTLGPYQPVASTSTSTTRNVEYQLGSDASSKVFTLANAYTLGVENLRVERNGVGLRRGSSFDYTETSTTSITLTFTPLDNDVFAFIINDSTTSTVADASGITYTPAGTGAQATNVQAKLRESVSVKGFGATGDGVTDEATVTNTALAASSNIYFPSGTYAYNSSINAVNNMVLEGAGYQKTTLLIATAYINLIYAATAKSKITIKNLTLKGSGSTASVERLIYLISCTDIDIINCRFENASHQIQLETCVRASIKDNRFENALRLDDYSSGYGVLASLNCEDIQTNENHFKTIGRHCVYYSSGTSNSEMIGNIANDITGAAYDVFSTTAQNTCKNITIADNQVDGITAAAGGSDDRFGVIATGNIQNLTITNNKISNNTQDGGIQVQHASSDANTMKTVKISGNIIDTCTGEAGINVLNCEDLEIIGNTIKDTGSTYSGISVAVSGTDVGSFVTNALIENNDIDNAKYGLNVSGTDATHKASGIVIGDNKISNATTANYNMGAIANIDYKTKWEAVHYDFFVDNAVASQTDTVMTAGNGSGFNSFIAPFTGRLYAIFGKSNAAISASSITFELRQNGANRTNSLTISAGDLYEKSIFALNTRTITEGDEIQMIYTTDGSYSPATNEYVCGIVIVRDINA